MRGSVVSVLVGLAMALAACSGSDGSAATTSGDPDPGRIGPQGRVAQFIVQCELSHIAFDDPIVLPWQTGKSHQHQFFGNRAVTADPGYEQAIGAETSCDQRLDTAAYWTPTLLGNDGNRIEAIEMTAYYRPGNGVAFDEVVAYPPGFMMVAGDASADEPPSTNIVAWSCGSGARRDEAPPACSSETTLRMIVTFPDCWDSSRLTAFGSGAHVRYSEGGCPETHPVALPQLQMTIDYPPVDPAGLSLSSGPIESAHADFWNTWDQDKLEREVTGCLNRDLICGVSG